MKNLAQVTDDYYATRQKRLALQKETDKLELKEKELRDYLIDNLPKSKIGGVAGKLARVEVETRPEPVIEDRDAFFKAAKKEPDLATVRMNAAAVKERWEAGKTVAGVGRFNVVKLHLHAIKQKRK